MFLFELFHFQSTFKSIFTLCFETNLWKEMMKLHETLSHFKLNYHSFWPEARQILTWNYPIPSYCTLIFHFCFHLRRISKLSRIEVFHSIVKLNIHDWQISNCLRPVHSWTCNPIFGSPKILTLNSEQSLIVPQLFHLVSFDRIWYSFARH